MRLVGIQVACQVRTSKYADTDAFTFPFFELVYLKLSLSIAYFATQYSGMMFLFEKEHFREIFRYFDTIRIADIGNAENAK